jgi:hypothetical protein
MTGKIILMTHAKPGPPGYHHVNLQPSEYWVDALTRRGCSLQVEDTNRIRRLAKQDDARYMADTGFSSITTGSVTGAIRIPKPHFVNLKNPTAAGTSIR